MKGWLKDRRLCICILLAVLIIYHLYFLWLSSVKMELSELLYADFMLLVVIGVCTVSDWYRWLKKTEGWQNAMQTASYVLSEELMMQIWSTDEFISDGSLTTGISRLKAKLRLFSDEDLIQTRKKQGYLLI